MADQEMAPRKEHVTMACYVKTMGPVVRYINSHNGNITSAICVTNGYLPRSGFLLFLGCTINGRPGDGTTRGTCNRDQLCQADGTCTSSVSIRLKFVQYYSA